MKIENKLFIDGKWVDASDGKTIEVKNPATGEVITEVQKASEKDLAKAIALVSPPWGGETTERWGSPKATS